MVSNIRTETGIIRFTGIRWKTYLFRVQLTIVSIPNMNKSIWLLLLWGSMTWLLVQTMTSCFLKTSKLSKTDSIWKILENYHTSGYIFEQDRKIYIEKMLEKIDMIDCKPRTTPCEQRIESSEDDDPIDDRKYRGIVSTLIYIIICTRPDISCIVTRLSQHLSNNLASHWIAVKHVLRYQKGTMDWFSWRFVIDILHWCRLGIMKAAWLNTDFPCPWQDLQKTTYMYSGIIHMWKRIHCSCNHCLGELVS